ncbi:MAG: hypothetical protein AAFO98_12500 [Pseudomonadota bacterium]
MNGAAWSGDMLHYELAAKKRRKLLYVRHMGYNAIRQEGTLEAKRFYEWTDELGILVLGGYACCSHWESPANGERVRVENGKRLRLWQWNNAKRAIARDSLWSQLYKTAGHASFLAWFNGSDFPPKYGQVEADYDRIYASIFNQKRRPQVGYDQVIPFASSFSRRSLFGPSGTKMSGPYEHVPPIYWYSKGPRHTAGAAFGFNTEHGPGISIATAATLGDLDPALDITPAATRVPFGLCRAPGRTRSFALKQCTGTPAFAGGRPFFSALCRRYGKPATMGDFVRRVQFQNYEDHRAMNEAHGRNRHRSAFGHVYWMGMNGWPSLRWNLFDYYLRTGGTFYGAKKGNAPLHVSYSYDDDSVWLVNRTQRPARGLTVEVQAFDRAAGLLTRRTLGPLTVSANASAPSRFTLPKAALFADAQSRLSGPPPDTIYVVLSLRGADGRLVSRNVYWLSRSRDVLAARRSDNKAWAYAKMSSTATYTDLQRTTNSRPDIIAVQPFKPGPKMTLGDAYLTGYRVVLRNPSERDLSLFWKIIPVHDGKTDEVRFQLWSDNFVTLLPSEQRAFTVLVDKAWAGKLDFSVTR